jgi:hypothetical protein
MSPVGHGRGRPRIHRLHISQRRVCHTAFVPSPVDDTPLRMCRSLSRFTEEVRATRNLVDCVFHITTSRISLRSPARPLDTVGFSGAKTSSSVCSRRTVGELSRTGRLDYGGLRKVSSCSSAAMDRRVLCDTGWERHDRGNDTIFRSAYWRVRRFRFSGKATPPPPPQ